MALPVRVRARRLRHCEEPVPPVQPGRGRASGDSGGAQPVGSLVLGAGPARFDASEQGHAPVSASIVTLVSAAGGAGEGGGVAADRTGKDGSFLRVEGVLLALEMNICNLTHRVDVNISWSRITHFLVWQFFLSISPLLDQLFIIPPL